MDDYNHRIKLYEQREFGEKINATFTFLRQNVGPFFKAQFYIAGPVAIILTILYTILFESIFDGLENGVNNPLFFTSGTIWNTFATYLMTILMTLVVALVNFVYMRLYHENNREAPDVNSVFQLMMQNFWKAVLIGIIWAIFIAVGMLFLILPGIYLAVVASLAYPILVIESSGVERAVDRPFKLIRDKWFSTFGLLLVTGIIGAILASLISLPVSIFTGVQVFLGIEEGNADISEAFPTWAIALGTLLGYVGNIVSGAITNTAIGFQYYNLVEMKESRGLLGEIDKMDEKDDDSANEGRY